MTYYKQRATVRKRELVEHARDSRYELGATEHDPVTFQRSA